MKLEVVDGPQASLATGILFRYLLLAAAVVLAVQLARFIYTSLASPLRSVPGPILARFTRLYYFWRCSLGRWEHDEIALHKKYGPVVRVGPNMYSIDHPEVVKKVYGINSKFIKSDWYYAWQHPDPNRWTVFPDRDVKRHAEARKRFQSMYSMSSLVNYEGYVDSCADIFGKRLTEFAAGRQTIDMAHWFQCYAFDVIGDITYSQRFGFLDKGEDIEGLLKALHSVLKYGALVGIYAEWHPWLFKISNWLGFGGGEGRVMLMKYVNARIKQRKEEKQSGHRVEKTTEKDENAPMDFLEKLLTANEHDPDKVTAYHVFMMGLSNIIAGSDTTAVSLSSILYNLIRHPETMRKLRQEIHDFEEQGRCSNPAVSFKQSQEMPYLQAVMKEALRMHAAVGLPLWRVVPEGGVEICDRFFPEGTIIGLNSWCAHYNRSVFGPDADQFRPERWLEAEKEGGERLREMDNYYLPVSCMTGSDSAIPANKDSSLAWDPAHAWVDTFRSWRCPS
jgi:cytochrome P450